MEQRASFEPLEAIVIRFDRGIDILQASRLEDTLSGVKSAPWVFLDLTNTSWFDKRTLHKMCQIDEGLRRRGSRLLLIGATGAVRRILEVTNLCVLFHKNATLNAEPQSCDAHVTSHFSMNAPQTF